MSPMQTMHFDHMNPPLASLNPPSPPSIHLSLHPSSIPHGLFFIFIPHLVHCVPPLYVWGHLLEPASSIRSHTLKKSDSPFLTLFSCQYTQLAVSPSKLHAGMFTGLILCGSSVDSHSST